MAHIIVTDKIDLPGKGEDFLMSESSNGSAIACIADGVSRSEESRQGAITAVNIAFHSMQSTGNITEVKHDYISIYKKITAELNQQAESHLKLSAEPPQSLFATTLITGCISEFTAEFSYVGNGAIFQITNEWWDLPDDNLMLLGINNYLNPHIRLKDGDTPLHKVLKYNQNDQNAEPDTVTIIGNIVRDSLFLICTDGLYSAEDISFFHHPEEGDFYRKENPRLMLFLQTLKKHKETIRSTPNEFMNSFRENIIKSELLNDDLSYALFIP